MQDAEGKETLHFGPFQMNLVKRVVWRGGADIGLDPTEFEVLLILVKNAGHPTSPQSILEAAWPGIRVEMDSVYQAISRLRRKLGTDETGRNYIPRRKHGYQLAAIVTAAPHVSLPSSCADTHAGQNREVASAPTSAQHLESAAELVTVPTSPDELKRPFRGPWVFGFLLLLVVMGATAAAVLVGALRPGSPSLRQYPVPGVVQLTRDGRLKQGPLLFDGRRLWFQELFRGQWKIVSVPAGGGEPQPVALALKNFALMDVGTDGSALLVQYEGSGRTKLWSWPLAGRDLQLLPFPAASAAWSPDRQIMVYAQENSLIFIQDGLVNSRMHLPPGTVASYPHWSPDCKHITFTLNGEGAHQTLQIADRVSGEVQPITRPERGDENQEFGAWSRDGRYYIFSACSSDNCDLWMVPDPVRSHSPDLVQPRRLTNRPLRWAWPAPGTTTGELYAVGEVWRGELVKLSQDDREWRPYLDPDGIPAFELDYSRDGQWIVYVHYPDHRLWVTRADGTQRHQLEWPNFEAHQPHWSPDGKRIAFMGRREKKWRVELVDVTADHRWEPIPAGDDQGVPTWVNNNLIVYGDLPSSDPKQVMKLHVLDLKKKETTVMQGSEGLWTVRCSPDGKYLSALRHNSNAHEDTEVLVSRRGSTEWTPILSKGNFTEQTWSADSRWLYLTNDSPEGRALLRVDALNMRVEKLADLHDFPMTSEQWFGVALDGSPLALRSVKTQEIYSIPWRP